MTGLVANLLLNFLLVGLLSATIIYCYILNRRIQVLQDSKSELAALLKQFDESTVKASETIVAMQTAGKKISDNIQMKLDKANYLLDDLSFSIEKATRVTDQIEASIAVQRATSKVQQHAHAEDDAATTPLMNNADRNGHELHTASTKRNGHSAAPDSPKRAPASIEALLEKVVSRKQHQEEHVSLGAAVAGKSSSSSRSRAEQELIELIRSSRG